MRIKPFTLTGGFVQLEPIVRDHAPALAAAGSADRSSYGYTAVPHDVASAQAYIDGLLDDAQRDLVVPFAQRRRADHSVVGRDRKSTRLNSSHQ